MLGHPIDRREGIAGAVILACTLLACGDNSATSGGAVAPAIAAASVSGENHHSASGDAKAFIGGWLEGQAEPVALRYTRSYFCAEPPTSRALFTDCEIGAPPEVLARPGLMPKIYALGPAGFQPDPSTVHCRAGTVCPNHPPDLDLSRVGGSTSVPAPAHSHIITDRQGGWHQTVNIRVGSLAVWNLIANAPDGARLAKVRELQADPAVGGAGLISQDRPTNVFFFFEVHASALP